MSQLEKAIDRGPQPGDAILSVRQPYALLIVERWKPIENRSWPTNHRGVLWIHASKAKLPPDWKKELLNPGGIPQHEIDAMTFHFGAIIGAAHLDGCFTFDELPRHLSGNIHAVGEHCWHFTGAYSLDEPIPYKGAVNLMRYDKRNLL